MSSYPTPVPSFHRPLDVVDSEHHGAWVSICAGFGLTCIWVALVVRLYVRKTINPPFWNDDWILAASTLLGTIQSILVLVQERRGLGTSLHLITPGNLQQVEKLGYVADILFIASLYTSKISLSLFWRRITKVRKHISQIHITASICGYLGGISLLLIGIHCPIASPWEYIGGNCMNSAGLKAQWSVLMVLDVFTELALFAMSIALVKPLALGLSKKVRVVLTFSIRLPVIGLTVVRLYLMFQLTSSSDPTLVGAVSSLCTQLELTWAILMATIPCFVPFLSEFTTHFGAMGGETFIGGILLGESTTPPQSGQAGERKTQWKQPSFSFKALSSSKDIKPIFRQMEEEMLAAERPRHQSQVTANLERSVSNTDTIDSINADSTRMIIKKKTGWTVEVGSIEGDRGN